MATTATKPTLPPLRLPPGASKGAKTAARRIQPHAVRHEVFVDNPGDPRSERVRAVINDHDIRVDVENGEIAHPYTCRVGLIPDSRTDYFPGTYWSSLAQAIASCLPDERATAYDLAVGGCTGYLTVNVYREGAGLKPVAFLDLYLGNHPTRYGLLKVRKVKAGPLLHLCQAFVAAGGQDAACTCALLDWLEEFHEDGSAYLGEARNPPPRPSRLVMPA